MSRSRKKPIIKSGYRKKEYWKTIRRVLKQKVHKIDETTDTDIILPKPQEIINDYDYYDLKIDFSDGWAGEDIKNKISRK